MARRFSLSDLDFTLDARRSNEMGRGPRRPQGPSQ
jgi:hypothetical protein